MPLSCCGAWLELQCCCSTHTDGSVSGCTPPPSGEERQHKAQVSAVLMLLTPVRRIQRMALLLIHMDKQEKETCSKQSPKIKKNQTAYICKSFHSKHWTYLCVEVNWEIGAGLTRPDEIRERRSGARSAREESGNRTWKITHVRRWQLCELCVRVREITRLTYCARRDRAKEMKKERKKRNKKRRPRPGSVSPLRANTQESHPPAVAGSPLRKSWNQRSRELQ